MSYVHRGVVKTNGFVDTARSITDSSKLKVLPSDDGFHLMHPETGNFEWWYFDIIDVKTDCMLKIVAHLGTDPLRRKFFPQLAISLKTPAQRQALIKPYSLEDFHASADFCDVRLNDEFRARVEPDHQDGVYHLTVNTDEFRARLTFIGEIEGWKPLGDAVGMERGRKRGEFFWVVPLPRARVVGEFSFGSEKYELKEALGYHDHNYWKVDARGKLFMDDVISHWYWGRFLADDYTVIFMDTYLKKNPVKSLLIAREGDIIHSSNNLIEVLPDEFKEDEEIKTPYPSRITVRSFEGDNRFHMTLNAKEVIEKRDLLDGINPFVKWLIKLLVSRPAYYGILADSAIHVSDLEIKGMALYELMYFRGRRKGVMSNVDRLLPKS